MTKENKFKIGLCLQEIALSLDDATLERNRDRLKQIEDIIIAEEEQEPKTGHWIDTGSGQECSKCHEIQYGYDNHRFYCANCGARMKSEVKDDNNNR